MFYDHEFESDTTPGTNQGLCSFPVPKFQPNPDHPHGYFNERGIWVTDQPCGKDWTSVVHPPDQFRHWCSILEAGGDCMHMEDW